MNEAEPDRSRSEAGLGSAGWSAILVGVTAATLPAVLPVMVGVLAENLGLGTLHAGYVASINMGGIAAGSLFCAALVRRWPWYILIRCGATTMILANVLTLFATSYSGIALSRGVAGLGEGVVQAICYAAMGRTARPARAIALYFASQGLVGAVGMGLIPTVVAKAGWQWLFIVVAAAAAPALWLAKPIQTLHKSNGQASKTRGRDVSRSSIYALMSILMFFVGISAVWAFVERIGHGEGMSLALLSMALSFSAIANMGGSLAAAFVAHRMTTVQGLLTGTCIALGGLCGLVLPLHWLFYLAGLSLLYFSWGFYYPFQFELLTRVDTHGRMTLLLPLMTGGGLATGPALGGILLSRGGAMLLCTGGAVCIVVSAMIAIDLNRRSLRAGSKEELPLPQATH